jgi:predicted O-methyltransferase YrrM
MITEITDLKPTSILSVVPKEFFIEIGTAHDEYILSGNYYEWYYAIAKFFNPHKILEIGVRYGYSLGSMLAGASNCKTAVGYDIDSYVENGLNISEQNIGAYIQTKAKINLRLENSQGIQGFKEKFDLAHIDGDHSYEGKIHDLNLCAKCSKIIILDDYNFLGEVKRAWNDWLRENYELVNTHFILNSVRGTLVIIMK